MPRPFTDRERELIKKRLLEQGERLFSAYGLKKTNVEEIAHAAGISKGAFYHFYASKEELLMDVIEQAEERLRHELFAVIDSPGPSPRLRLFTILKRAFTLFEKIPLLQYFTGSDYDLLFRRVPPEIFQQHLADDRVFIDKLIDRCLSAGIPIQVSAEQFISLLYPLAFAFMHKGDLDTLSFNTGFDMLLELVAASCLGEVDIQSINPASLATTAAS